MAYCSQTQFEGEFGAAELASLLVDRAGGFDAAAADADGEINDYLAGRYALPLSVVPASVTGIALDITRFRLYDEAAPEIVVERYRRAVQRLRDIANGLALLTGADGLPLPAPSAEGAITRAPAAPVRTLVYGTSFDDRYGLLDPARVPGVV